MVGALDGDGSMLLALADATTGREVDGTFGPAVGSEAAVACLDPLFPTSPAEVDEVDRRIAEVAPRARGAVEVGWRTCADWPIEPRDAPTAFVADGAAPILVVGATGDPSTPYEWAIALADGFADAVLLTYEGDVHVATLHSACVAAEVVAYVETGELPPVGTVCEAEPTA